MYAFGYKEACRSRLSYRIGAGPISARDPASGTGRPVRVPSRINGTVPSRINGKKTVNGVDHYRPDLPQAGEGRIVVMMPDGTVLTVIGATRLVLGLSDRSPTAEPLPA